MEWIATNWLYILTALYFADKVAKATPPDFKVWKIPVGKWDDAVVDSIKELFGWLKSGKSK